MTPEEKKRNRVMDYAFKSFTTAGFSRVTMDDIARGVGMGKGTVYKLFPSKEALILSTVDYFAGRVEQAIEEVLTNDKLTAVDKLNLFLKAVAEKLSAIHPGIVEYFERTMPEVYEKIEKTRQRIIMNNLVRVLEEGKKEGLIDPRMDLNLIAHMVIGTLRYIIESQVLSSLNYSFDQLFVSITNVILKGCMTEEGRKRLV
ncbi:MAG: Transcriptional regulator [Herbinix sp.]|jgi:AcrR family transcriptional regulator|nr:Transcriptional regulator [Herbinix sp.]